jgi:peptidoglycan/xylan/chitin deacetylase (PgdA/CDA1 family)
LSLIARREPSSHRSVLIPVERLTVRERERLRNRRRRRALLLVVVVAGITVAAATVYAVQRSGRHEATKAPPPARVVRRAPKPQVAVSVAQARERSVANFARLALPVFCGAPHGNEIALTFDDGPGPYTNGVLRTLRRYGAQATFFLVGNRIRYWRGLVAAEARVGAVGDHTWSHADLVHLPRGKAVGEIERARTAIEAAGGGDVRMFRPPYGLLPGPLGHLLATQSVLDVRWSVDSGDWLHGATAARVLTRVAPGLHAGAIVLLHDLHPWTARALPRILALARARHLRAVTVPELLRSDPPSYSQLVADNRGRGCVRLTSQGE